MSISKVGYKAQQDEVGKASTGPTTAAALEMKKKLQAALDQIAQAEQYDQYFTMSERAELEKSKALIMADLQAIDYFLKTGEWLGPVLPSGVLTGNQMFDLDSVDSGWYQYDQAGNLTRPQLDDDPSGRYTKIVNIENNTVVDSSGQIVPTKVWFVMTNEMTELKGENRGNDILITVSYVDGRKETYLIKNGAIRTDIQIGVNALKNDMGVTINFSRTAIINPKTGEKGGVYIIGSKAGDVIYGSAGKDEINGAGGGDLIDGMAGDDNIYGGASSQVRTAYGDGNLGTDGNDEIYDVFGGDLIDAGPGNQDVAYRGMTSNTVVPAINEEGMEPDLSPSRPSDIEGWFDGTDSHWTVDTSGSSEVVIKRNDANDMEPVESVIGMSAAEGYMVTATREGQSNDLILTAVKLENGRPKYYRIRIKNYFGSENEMLRLQLSGSFIDMGQVNIGTRAVNMTGTASEGDILIAPKTIFDEYGITVEDLGNSNMDQKQLEELLKPYQEDYYSTSIWHDYESNGGGEITVDASDFMDGGIDIPATFGSIAFVQRTSDNTLRITVVSNTGLDSTRIVINVNNAYKGIPITFGGSSSKVKYISNSNDLASLPGVMMNGADGIDFVAGGRYGATIVDAEGYSIKYKPTSHEAGPDTTMTAEDFISDIESASDFNLLDKYQATVNKYDDPVEKKKLQEKINKRRETLIRAAIESLDKLKTAYDYAVQKGDSNKIDAARKAFQKAIDQIKEQIKKLSDPTYGVDTATITSVQAAYDEKIKNVNNGSDTVV